MTDSGDLVAGATWQLIKTVPNPWGKVPMTAGGKSLPSGAREYMSRLAAQQRAMDTVSRRHHYVPKSYLREWSFDGKRLWSLDTVTGVVRPLGLSDVCVEENFYRVRGADGSAHNRVELLFGVVDAELRRVQELFNRLDDPETLEFDDLVGLGVSMAVQRMRTLQQRRLRMQHSAWLHAQSPEDFPAFDDPSNPHLVAGLHTRLLFDAMWEAADVLTSRQLEVWHDPQGRFMTCDAPVLVPFRRNVRPNLVAAPYVIWPLSPERAVALSNDHQGQKAVMREVDGQLRGLARLGVEQGRERMIFASEEQSNRLPKGKKFRRRAQSRLRCSDRLPTGEPVPPPGCCVEWSEAFDRGPDVSLCDRGLHSPAPSMWAYA